MPPRTQGPRPRTSRTLKEQKTLDMKRRDIDMWKMRGKGNTIEDIAEHYDLSPATVRNCLNRAADEYQVEAAEHVVKMELARLDTLLTHAMEVLERRHVAYSHGKLMTDERGEAVTDSAPVLHAIKTVMGIMDRRSRYLGLDAPSKTEQTISVYKKDNADLELQEMLNEAKARMANLSPQDLHNE